MDKDTREALERLESELLADGESPELEERSPEINENEETHRKNDKLTIGLLLTVCFLCLGLIGVMIYWLETYL